MKNETALIVAAHPDDEVLGCGGTIARLSAAGSAVHVLILGEGATSRMAYASDARKSNVRSRLQKHARKAAAILGVRDVYFQNFPDNSFDTVPLLDIVRCIETYIQRIRPTIIFTHWHGDLNIDHVIVNRATLIAARPSSTSRLHTILTHEIPSSSEWSISAFKANLYVDISATIKHKLCALNVYTTERRSFPHPRSLDGLRYLASVRGMECGRKYAEGFIIQRSIQ